LITCASGVPGDCPGNANVGITYVETNGFTNTISLTGANQNAGYVLCARNYPFIPYKSSGSSLISITDIGSC